MSFAVTPEIRAAIRREVRSIMSNALPEGFARPLKLPAYLHRPDKEILGRHRDRQQRDLNPADPAPHHGELDD